MRGVQTECVICNSSFECNNNSFSSEGNEQLNHHSIELKLAFGLLCKLINVTVETRQGDERKGNYELYKLLEEFGPVSSAANENGDGCDGSSSGGSMMSSTCKICFGALEEIIRLERAIEDLKVSQIALVKELKKSLTVRNPHRNDKRKRNDKNDYWKLIRSQLIACLETRGDLQSSSSAKRLRSDVNVNTTTTDPLSHGPGRRKPRKQLISASKTYEFKPLPDPLSLIPSETVDAKDPPVLKPCFVKLTRLNAAAIKPTTEKPRKTGKSSKKAVLPVAKSISLSFGGGERPTRQSKQKAYQFLRETLSSSSSCHPNDKDMDTLENENIAKDEDWIVNDEEQDNISSDAPGDHWGDEDVEDFDDFSPPLATDNIKRENDDDAGDPLYIPHDQEDMDYESQQEAQEDMGDQKVYRDKKAKTKVFKFSPTQNSKTCRMSFVAHNLYLYNCTLVKFFPVERHYICQEPDCATLLSGTMLDSSIFQCIRAHVDHHHNSVCQADGKIRSCPICPPPVHIRGGPKKFRKHLSVCHGDVCQKIQTVVCEVCGKHGFANSMQEHKWTHRNFDEKVAALKAGENYPTKLKKGLKLKPQHPFYPLVFGTDTNSGQTEELNNFEKRGRPEVKSCHFPKSSAFYRLQNNIYLYSGTTFKYCPKRRTFACQEPDCSQKFAEWDHSVISKIRAHVLKRHRYHSCKNELAEEFVRTCPLCCAKILGRLSFHNHLVDNHNNEESEGGSILCEVCLEPLRLSENYMRHLWTHKSKDEISAAIRKKGTIKNLKNRSNNLFYLVNESTLLIKCTVISVQDNGSRLECKEPGCNAVFQAGSPMDFYGLLEQVKNHVVSVHEKCYQFDEENGSGENGDNEKETTTTRACPVCSRPFVSALEMRHHFFTAHAKKMQKEKGEGMVICQVCWKPFFHYGAQYRLHMDTHMGVPERSSQNQGTTKKKMSKVGKRVLKKTTTALAKKNRTKETATGLPQPGTREAERKPVKEARIYNLAENVYLYKCTVIKFSKGQFLCQEPACGTPLVPGTLHDGLLFENVRKHVDQHHGAILKSDGQVRTCPLCPHECNEAPKRFRKHIELKHTTGNHLKRIVCQVCGKSGFANKILEHGWSHRTFDEQVHALEQGEHYPIRLERELKESDPLYHFVFGDREGVKKRKKYERLLKAPPREITEGTKVPFQPDPSSKLDFVYIFPENLYLYRSILFSYCPEKRQFSCREDGCTEKIDEWDETAVDKLKSHVFTRHYCAWNRRSDESVRTCPLCFEPVSGPQRFHNHMLENHSGSDEDVTQGGILCEICLQPLPRSQDYLLHLSTHGTVDKDKRIATALKKKTKLASSGGAPITCHICGKMFARLSSLKAHSVKHENPENRKKFPCPQCNLQLLSSHGVMRHMERVHMPGLGTTRTCLVSGCGKVFYRRDYTKFKDHMRQHKGETGWICDLCGKGFYARTALVMHTERVHGPKRHQCDECGKKYSSSNHLKRHRTNAHAND